jgi:flagellar export protein FliJ
LNQEAPLLRAKKWLQIKRAQEDQAALKLRHALEAKAEAREALQRLIQWQNEYGKAGMAVSRRWQPHAFQSHQGFLEGLNVQRRRAEEQIAALEKAIRQRRSALQGCAQRRRIAEQRLANLLKQLQQKRLKAEQRQADELACNHFSRAQG